MKDTYSLIGLGGTFDLLHKGHKDFLRFALSKGQKLLLGISSDSFAEGRKHHVVESFADRKSAVERFLRDEGFFDRVEIAELSSVFVPEKWADLPLEAIFATEDSLGGAKTINEKRESEGKEVLAIVSYPLSLAEDGFPIATSRIREGVIDREGNLFVKKEWYETSLILPDNLRRSLQEPWGVLVDTVHYTFSAKEQKKILAVGDVTTALFHGRGIVPALSVVDLRVEREKTYDFLSEMPLKNVNLTYTVQNTPGQISSDAFRAVCESFQAIADGKTVLIHVIGEEDLLVLPVILHAPLGFILYYGQPKKGTVKVVVTEEVKLKTRSLVEKFEKK